MELHFTTKPTPAQWADWRWQMANAARSLEELVAMAGLPSSVLDERRSAAAKCYPVFATPYYLSRALSPDANDPIIRQCLPEAAEVDEAVQGGGDPDALDELRCSPVPRLVHRYPDRALLVTGNICAVHCRHCMRKRDWGVPMAPPTDSELDAICGYLSKHPEVREVLVSGGDPLMLPEEALETIIARLSAIPSIEMLRFGSRVPVVLPQKVSPRLASLLTSGKTAWVATHFNHPAELSPEVNEAIRTFLKYWIPVVNQSVLLKGVNDSAEVLGRLFTGLLKMRIKPYYLFHGDPIRGAMHFRTGVQAGLEIMDQLRGRISGMAIPAFAFDLPHGAGKIRLQPEHQLGSDAGGHPIYCNYQGEEVAYR